MNGMMWLELEGERCFGLGRMQLLQCIDKTGSMNRAAKEMKINYIKAWTMISELNEQFTEPKVITQSGGEGGGGSVLTNAVRLLMNYHIEIREKFAAFLKLETINVHK